MIRLIKVSDKDKYYELGSILNGNFNNLYNFEDTLSKDYNKIYVYEIDNKVIGFIHIMVSFDSADIVNIVIDDKYRNNGYGKELISYAIKDNNLHELNLEVRKSNKAVNFYLNNGFDIIREIPNYYHGENAYFMKKVI